MPDYRQDVDSIKGDIEKYKKGGMTLFRGHEDEANPVNDRQDELSLALDTIRGENDKISQNKMDLVVPDANSELAQFMEPYTEELDKPPIYESHVRSPKGTMLDVYIHSFVGLRFTGVHPRTHRIGRYYVRAGFASSGNDDTPGKSHWYPGGLRDDTHSHADISVQRETTANVVDDALRFIPAHAHNSSYHVLRHNCNHFAREVAAELGFGEIAGMHAGMSPTTAYKNMTGKAQEGDSSFFLDNYKETGNGETDYLGDSQKILNLRDDRHNSHNNDMFSQLNSALFCGTPIQMLPATQDSFIQEADQKLKDQFAIRINKAGQFGSKNAARTEIATVAQGIGRTEAAISGIATESFKRSQQEKNDVTRRVQNFNDIAGETVESTRRLMMRAGRRYSKLGAYSLKISTSFSHLISRVNSLAQDSGIEDVAAPKSYNEKYSDAEVISMFSEQESNESVQRTVETETAQDTLYNIMDGKFDIDSTSAITRAGFILKNIPEYQKLVGERLLNVRKENKADKHIPQGMQEEFCTAIEETAMLNGVNQLMLLHPDYMQAIMSLFYRQREAYSPEHLALMLMREMATMLGKVRAPFDNLGNTKTELNSTGGIIVGEYILMNKDKKLSKDNAAREAATKIEQGNQNKEEPYSIADKMAERNKAYLDAFITLKGFAEKVKKQGKAAK